MRLVLLLVHAAIVQIVSYALRPAVSYAILDLGYDSAWLGIATAAFAVPPLVLAIPAGRMTDRRGERVSLAIGAGAFVASALLVVLAGRSLAGLLLATAFLGLGVLYSVLGEQTWVMRGAPGGRLDSAFGLYTFVTSAGQMAGPLLLLLPDPGGPHGVDVGLLSLLCLAAAVLLCALSAAIPPVRAEGAPAPSSGMLRDAAALVRRPGVLQALVASSLVLASLDIALSYLPLLATERGLAAAWITVMLVGRGAATMLSRITLHRLTRRFGRRRVLVGGGVLAAAALAGIALPLPPVALAAAAVVYGLAAGTVQPLTMSWVTLVTPVEQRGVAASLRLVGNRVGQTVIPLGIAALSSIGGGSLVFAATGASLLVSALAARVAPDEE